jgi:hypothetical protein
MAEPPSTPVPPQRSPEPPPPLGSWTRFYLLVAVIHVLVVLALTLFSNAYRFPPVPR